MLHNTLPNMAVQLYLFTFHLHKRCIIIMLVEELVHVLFNAISWVCVWVCPCSSTSIWKSPLPFHPTQCTTELYVHVVYVSNLTVYVYTMCVCVFVMGEGKRKWKRKWFARVCMHTVGECFQSVRGIFHGHTRWVFGNHSIEFMRT